MITTSQSEARPQKKTKKKKRTAFLDSVPSARVINSAQVTKNSNWSVVLAFVIFLTYNFNYWQCLQIERWWRELHNRLERYFKRQLLMCDTFTHDTLAVECSHESTNISQEFCYTSFKNMHQNLYLMLVWCVVFIPLDVDHDTDCMEENEEPPSNSPQDMSPFSGKVAVLVAFKKNCLEDLTLRGHLTPLAKLFWLKYCQWENMS